jgi:hypothetical protein
LKRPPPLIELDFSFVIPRVAHIELFAASLGSSILKVFGTKTPVSDLVPSLEGSSKQGGLRMLPSLECFPSGKVGLELWVLWFRVADGEDAHGGTFQGLGTVQPQ